MTLRLTPPMLMGAYDFLRETPPFRGWKLPPGESVEFRVTRDPARHGAHTTYRRTKDHVVEVSERCVGHTETLVRVMAHEMIHVRQAERATTTPNTEHNAEFRRLAAAVCRRHGFDPKEFL